MPRKEYLKYFARDRYNIYIGTEKERLWTDGDLEVMFGRYRAAKKPKRIAARDVGRVVMVEDSDDIEWKAYTMAEKL